jgi:hypothetical protein
MIIEIKAFLLVLSFLYMIKNLFTFIVHILQTDPEPIRLTKVEVTLLYLSLSYFITYFILFFTNV